MKLGIKKICIVCDREYKTDIDSRRTHTCSKSCSKVYCRIQNSINSMIYKKKKWVKDFLNIVQSVIKNLNQLEVIIKSNVLNVLQIDSNSEIKNERRNN